MFQRIALTVLLSSTAPSVLIGQDPRTGALSEGELLETWQARVCTSELQQETSRLLKDSVLVFHPPFSVWGADGLLGKLPMVEIAPSLLQSLEITTTPAPRSFTAEQTGFLAGGATMRACWEDDSLATQIGARGHHTVIAFVTNAAKVVPAGLKRAWNWGSEHERSFSQAGVSRKD